MKRAALGVAGTAVAPHGLIHEAQAFQLATVGPKVASVTLEAFGLDAATKRKVQKAAADLAEHYSMSLGETLERLNPDGTLSWEFTLEQS